MGEECIVVPVVVGSEARFLEATQSFNVHGFAQRSVAENVLAKYIVSVYFLHCPTSVLRSNCCRLLVAFFLTLELHWHTHTRRAGGGRSVANTMGNDVPTGMRNDEVVHIRRSTFRARTATSQPLKIISVDVKGTDSKWRQYTACLYNKKGGYSLEYGNVRDQFAVAMQLSSIHDISVERVNGGHAVRIVQGSDPRHNKVTTFRFDSIEAAQQFQTTITDYQHEEREVAAGRARAHSGGRGYAGEAPIRRTMSTEEEREMVDLKKRFMTPKKGTSSDAVRCMMLCPPRRSWLVLLVQRRQELCRCRGRSLSCALQIAFHSCHLPSGIETETAVAEIQSCQARLEQDQSSSGWRTEKVCENHLDVRRVWGSCREQCSECRVCLHLVSLISLFLDRLFFAGRWTKTNSDAVWSSTNGAVQTRVEHRQRNKVTLVMTCHLRQRQASLRQNRVFLSPCRISATTVFGRRWRKQEWEAKGGLCVCAFVKCTCAHHGPENLW